MTCTSNMTNRSVSCLIMAMGVDGRRFASPAQLYNAVLGAARMKVNNNNSQVPPYHALRIPENTSLSKFFSSPPCRAIVRCKMGESLLLIAISSLPAFHVIALARARQALENRKENVARLMKCGCSLDHVQRIPRETLA